MNERQYHRYLKNEIEKSLIYRRVLEKQKNLNWIETAEWRKEVERYTEERVNRFINIGLIK